MKSRSTRKTVAVVVLLFLLAYIMAVLLPFIRHKEVSSAYKESFRPTDCYSGEAGTERVAYIADNTDALVWRLRMLKEAQEEILLSTFEFNSDEAGKAVSAALLSAAERGVQVRILVDGMNAFLDQRGSDWFQALVSHENISMKIYNPINLAKPWKLQARLHDKYVVIDGKMYLLGGRNTTNLFLGDYQKAQNLDRELFVYETGSLEGSSLEQLRAYFEAVWALPDCKAYACKRQTKKREGYVAEMKELYLSLQSEYPEAFTDTDWMGLTMETNKVTFLSNPIEAENKEPWMWYALSELMKTGQKIVIHTPYIICGKEMYADLEALCSQVDSVDIITNDVTSGANPFGCTDYLNQKEKILSTGVRVHEYLGPHSSHTKTILIDGRISVVGSYNLDMRSTYLDTELMLVVDSEGLAQILAQEAEADMASSKSIAAGEEYQYGPDYVAREFSPLKKAAYFLLRILIMPIRRSL